ncbi:MAG: hypothetical protein IT282_07070, partial [Bacteroidetes bacterium]|nr:hypothetical protein [Bacteroidota bacterium]
MTHVRILFLLLFTAVFAGCEDTPSEVLDLVGAAPVLRSTSVSPSSFNLDNQQMTGTVYRLSTTLGATASDPQGVDDIRQVQWSVFAPSGGTPIAQGLLVPGVVSGAGVREYSSTATFEVERSGLGEYRMEIFAVDATNLKSSITQATLRVHLNDAPPVLSLAGARQTGSAGSDSAQFV